MPFLNSDFETGDLTDWATDIVGDGTVTVAATYKRGGSYGCQLYSHSNPDNCMAGITQDIVFGDSGNIVFYYKVATTTQGEDNRLIVSIKNDTYGTVYNNINMSLPAGDWVAYQISKDEIVDFDAATTYTFEVCSRSYSGVGESYLDAYVDDFSLDEPMYAFSTGIYNVVEPATGTATGVWSVFLSNWATAKYDILHPVASEIIIVTGWGVSSVGGSSMGTSAGAGGGQYVITWNTTNATVPNAGSTGDATTNATRIQHGNTRGLKIKKTLEGVDTCENQYVNPDSGQKTQLVYDSPVNIIINGIERFSGKIKRIQKDDNINVWTVFAEGHVADLRDRSVATTIKYEHYQPYYIITDLLPSGWTPLQYTGLGDYMDYTVTPGQALTHIQNVCKAQGWVWHARQHAQNAAVTAVSTTGITLDYTPDAGYWTGKTGLFTTGYGCNYPFSITAQSGATLTLSAFPTTVAVGDKVTMFGNIWFEFGTRIGSSTTATVAHYTINENACWLNRNQNVEKIVTSVVAVGQNPEVARLTSWATACTDNKAKLICSDSTLVVPATAGDTTLYPATVTFMPLNGTVQIGTEKITYTNKSATGLTGCTRGADSTTAAAHYPNDDVLLISEYWFDDTSLLQDSGGVWIGQEYISYTSKDATKLYDLTRGASSSQAYSHYYGTYAFDGLYSDTSPESESPVAIYGVKRKTIEVIGATTRDGLDKRAQQELFRYDDNIEYGDFTLLSSDFWEPIRLGDYILLTDKDGTDYEVKIVGVEYSPYAPVKVYFGQRDEYILEELAKVNSSLEVGREKNELNRPATVLQISDDGKSGLVKYDDDGSTEWKYFK